MNIVLSKIKVLSGQFNSILKQEKHRVQRGVTHRAEVCAQFRYNLRIIWFRFRKPKFEPQRHHTVMLSEEWHLLSHNSVCCVPTTFPPLNLLSNKPYLDQNTACLSPPPPPKEGRRSRVNRTYLTFLYSVPRAPGTEWPLRRHAGRIIVRFIVRTLRVLRTERELSSGGTSRL